MLRRQSAHYSGSVVVEERGEADEDTIPPEGSSSVTFPPRETHPPRVGTSYEAPAWNRVPYLTHGYRLYHRFSDCVSSLFYQHNELGTRSHADPRLL
jgi:hypothetical protein